MILLLLLPQTTLASPKPIKRIPNRVIGPMAFVHTTKTLKLSFGNRSVVLESGVDRCYQPQGKRKRYTNGNYGAVDRIWCDKGQTTLRYGVIVTQRSVYVSRGEFVKGSNKRGKWRETPMRLQFEQPLFQVGTVPRARKTFAEIMPGKSIGALKLGMSCYEAGVTLKQLPRCHGSIRKGAYHLFFASGKLVRVDVNLQKIDGVVRRAKVIHDFTSVREARRLFSNCRVSSLRDRSQTYLCDGVTVRKMDASGSPLIIRLVR